MGAPLMEKITWSNFAKFLATFVVGLTSGGFGAGIWWANNINRLNSVADQNTQQNTDISNVRNEVQKIKDDKVIEMSEWRTWREGVNDKLTSIQTDMAWLKTKFRG